MKRIAIIIHACHESIVGGSEALAWQYAQLLALNFEVEILTSCSTDYTKWNNTLPSGVSRREGITVRRFRTAFERTPYFSGLHRRLLDQFAKTQGKNIARRIPWRRALQEEFIKFQGPYCPEMIEYLRTNHQHYHALLFFTYLYPSTHLGAEAVRAYKSIFIPTLHDEPAAYLSAYAERAKEFSEIIWLTDAEKKVAEQLWGIHYGKVVGMAVDMIIPPVNQQERTPYFLYCGRIEQGKGCHELVAAFKAFRKKYNRSVKLLFTGIDNMGLPKRDDIDFLGFVDEQQKARLMVDALAFVLPSEYESFSIVTLEAMAQGTPVIVNGQCEVLREHIEKSNGGYYYRGESELVETMERVYQLTPEERDEMGQAGWRYVKANYEEEKIRERLVDIVQRVIENSEKALEVPESLAK